MTLAPSDAPDWLGPPGGMRYLGVLDMSGGPGLIQQTMFFSPASYDAAVYVIATGSPDDVALATTVDISAGAAPILVGRQSYYRQGEYMAEPMACFVSEAMDPNWRMQATITLAATSDWMLHLFAAPSFPMARIVRDQLPLLVRQNGVPRRLEVTDQTFSQPAAGLRATVTFAADPNGILGWVLDSASWRLMGRGAADIQSIRVLNGAAQIYGHRMSVQAVAGDRDEHTIGPLMGLRSALGNALVVEFTAAPGAANFETVDATAYSYAAL